MACRASLCVAACLTILVLTSRTEAQVYYNATYDASAGTLPDSACPSWTLTDTATPENPTVAAGVMTISTSVGTENITYRHVSPNLFLPPTLVIEFRGRFISGSSNNAARSSMSVSVTTSPSTGSIFFIESAGIFLTSGELVKGPSASVATSDAFHTYRIEIAGTAVSVYHDGTLTLSGSTYVSTSDHGLTPRIVFGEGASGAFGESQWQYFKHNAGGIVCTSPAFSVSYDASLGLFPDRICPPWTLVDSYNSEDPVLSGGKLILNTSNPTTRMFYQQSDLTLPDPFIVEFRTKLVSGSSTNPARGPITLGLTTAPNVGALFYIENGGIFFAAGHATDGTLLRGASASAPTTDAFHTYRLEVEGNGTVSAYQDGFRKLISHTYTDAQDHGPTPRVLFGEGSLAAQGISEWEFVRHNAVVPNSGPPTSFNLAVPGDGDTVSTWRVFLDWTEAVDPDCAGSVSYYIQFDSLSSFATAREYGPRAASQDTVVVEFVPGKSYYWRVKAVDGAANITWATPGYSRFVTYAGSYPTAVESDPMARRPISLRFRGPNPFGRAGLVEYTLPTRARVQLRVIDVSGRVVRTILNREESAGEHQVMWDGLDDRGAAAGAGVYFMRLQAGPNQASIKCILLR
jgi:hypothetical protein